MAAAASAVLARLALAGSLRLFACLSAVRRLGRLAVFQTLRGVLGVVLVIEDHGHPLADGGFDFLEILSLVAGAEGDRLAGGAGPCGPSDAVDVAFRLVGQVVVDHVGDPVHVDAPGGNVGGNQHAEFSRAEAVQRPGAGVLRLVAVDGAGRDVASLQLLADTVGAALGPREDQRPADLGVLHERGEKAFLGVLVHEHQRLVDPVGRRGLGGDLHADRIGQHAVGQLGDGLGHGRREEQRLALGRQRVDHAADVVDEAHVQHAVGFVEHEQLKLAQADEPLAHQVQQTSRGGHENVGLASQGLFLLALADAAEDDGTGQRQMTAIGVETVTDLGSQLSGGGENQRPDVTSSTSGLRQPLQHGQREGSGFAGARLGGSEQVSPFQQVRDGSGLNGRGRVVAFLGDGTGERLDEVEFSEFLYVGHMQRFLTEGCSADRARCER